GAFTDRICAAYVPTGDLYATAPSYTSNKARRYRARRRRSVRRRLERRLSMGAERAQRRAAGGGAAAWTTPGFRAARQGGDADGGEYLHDPRRASVGKFARVAVERSVLPAVLRR